MDLDRAFDQLLGGTTDVGGTTQGFQGNVTATGWDFGQVAEGIDNDYLINGILHAGVEFTATLDWFRDRQTFGPTGYLDTSYDNLDLQLWEVIGGTATKLISESRSLYNNTEHFSFLLPQTAQYLLRVHWQSELFDLANDANNEQYGLAWSAGVPEPSTVVLLAAVVPWAFLRQRLPAIAQR